MCNRIHADVGWRELEPGHVRGRGGDGARERTALRGADARERGADRVLQQPGRAGHVRAARHRAGGFRAGGTLPEPGAPRERAVRRGGAETRRRAEPPPGLHPDPGGAAPQTGGGRGVRGGEARGRTSRHRLAGNVKTAFYTLQGAEQMLELRQTVAHATELSAEIAGRQREAGNIMDLDLASERALADEAKLDLARAEADVLAGREELNALLGLWGPNTAWKVAPRLPGLPAEDLRRQGLESLA